MARMKTGIEWTAAIVAPWTVAPHPNFSSPQPRAEGLLALIADLRIVEINRFESHIVELSGWQNSLIQRARDSITADRQRAAGEALSALAINSDLPPGAQAAAALLATVALHEQDLPELAVETLSRCILHSSTLEQEFPDSQDSLKVIRCLLVLQRSMRYVELKRRDEAATDSRTVIAIAGSIGDRLDEFTVSESIGWDSRTVQLDMISATVRRAKTILSHLAPLGDNSWVELIRERPAWLDVRAEKRAAPAMESVIQAQFTETFHSTDRSTRWSIEEPVVGPLAASLLNAELSADFGRVENRRSILGKVLLLRSYLSGEVDNVDEGIRLLATADDIKSLNHAIRSLRSVGPISALSSIAVAILERYDRLGRLSRCDIALLQGASEMLTETQRTAAIDAVMDYLERDSSPNESGRSYSWAQVERAWGAIASLVANTTASDLVAQRAIRLLEQRDSPYMMTPVIYKLVQAVDWEKVGPSTVHFWRQWAMGNLDGEFYELAREIGRRIPSPSSQTIAFPRPTGLALAEEVLIEATTPMASPPVEAELRAAVTACKDEMQRVRNQAANRSYSFGPRSAPYIAVCMATTLGQTSLWQAIVEFISDPGVAAAHKSQAIARLAIDVHRIPEEVKAQLRSAWSSVASAVGNALFEDETIELRGAAIRLGHAIGAIDPDQFLTDVAELACGVARERIQALHCLARGELNDAQNLWAATLVNQLSLDSDPTVRANASFVLGKFAKIVNAMSPVLIRRLERLLVSDGITVPLSALRGIHASDDDHSSVALIRALSPLLQSLSQTHPAYSVREIASSILMAAYRSGLDD